MIAESIAARGMMRTLDIGFLAVEMAAHLRAGASYERAWQQSVRAAWEESAGKGPGGQQRGIGGGGLRWWKLLRGWEGCQEDDDVAVREGESGWAVPGVVAQYALPRSRPERGRLLHAIRAGGGEWERYLREWRMWWWARSPAGQRQRRAVEALAVACTFSGVVGAPLAEVLSRIGHSIDTEEADEEARDVASAGPAASAHILNVMPLVGLGAAGALGAEPLHFFTSSVLGALVAVVGVVLMIAGNVVSARMVAHARGRPPEGLDPALACDLVAAALESGAAIPRALDALGEASEMVEFRDLARALLHGQPWQDAWRHVPEGFVPLSQALQTAWEDGVSPVPGCERAAARLRQRRATQAQQQAARLNVRLVVPLGVFMLPSFIALGVVPLVVVLVEGLSG